MCEIKGSWKRYLCAVSLALTALSGCGKYPYLFEQLESCTAQLQASSAELRILFMVDNSGSTKTTDPSHHYRAETLRTFISQFGTKSNFSYAFGYFSGGSASVYDGALFTESPGVNFGDAGFLTGAVDQYVTVGAAGDTPYHAGFATLQSLVSGDVAVNGSRYSYVIVFMSDGMPTDLPDSVDSRLVELVAQLKASVPNTALTVSAVYFGPTSGAGAILNLKTIAQAGRGQFVDTNIHGTLAISDIITLPGHECVGQ
jgi:hypothetical protein